jgi:hypothetical protein
MSFAADCEKFRRKSFKGRMNVVVRKVSLDLFKKVVLRTPVDTGPTRANWTVGINHIPIVSVLGTANPIGRIVTDILRAQAGDNIALANSYPSVGTLEYGGFPNPPKKGTWIKGSGKKSKKTGKYLKGGQGHYEIKSVGGYSKQAPHGMVRVTVEEYKPTLMEAVAYAKGLK